MKVNSLFNRGVLFLAGACLAPCLLPFLLVGCSKQSSASNQATAAPIPANPATALPSPTQNPEDKMPRVKIDEAKQQVAQGKAIIIDVRGTDAYKMAHVKGALDIPLNKLESGDFSSLPKDKRIIAYCT